MSDAIAETPIFTADRGVAFQDVDAAGLVFFVRFFEYCHDVLFAFLGSRGIAMPEILASGKWAAPLAHVEADYTIPLRFGDRFTVAIIKVTIGGSSMRVDYRVSNARDKSVCTLHMVHVFIDRTSMRPCPAPENVREALKDCATFSAAK
jgi:1,4-dihydroxy-2-naphthoyl-CoA hydrolase